MTVKPKQLVFDDDEDCNLNDILMAARKADVAEESEQTWFKELDEKTIAMLKLIEEDVDSFAQRAEMYYKKRLELIIMEEFNESEVEDPEQVKESVIDVLETQEVVSGVSESIVAKLREEIERLKKENKVQKDQLTMKDEEKMEVIRNLSISMDILKENVVLSKKSKFKESSKKSKFKESSKKKGSFKFNKLKGLFSGMMLFNGSLKSHTNCVAL
ncbi:hypothetical protein GIB67_014218 [Kingdonia uniflora]|uniref:NAB domain-containing protein n=1 Tax=Kingdonia uniflora TaxID=39325 RepID=A0A7J7M1W7_9MAGN|nr:hypothetical protein GIB67_014218 [Kingdonia uniflora]